MIKTKSLTKNYQLGELTVQVLRGINLEIKDGEFVAITGLSGAGKSTLLYQLSLLDEPTSGEIFLNGQNTADFGEAKRTNFRLYNLGFVFQDYALMPELTASENVFLPLMMMGFSMRKNRQLAKEALDKLGVGDKLNNLPSQLSGGQQQRVAIARAIVNKPKILFADEPTASLDSQSSNTVMEAFKNLNADGQTIVMVTHENIYAKMAKRIIELADGQIISDKRVH